MSSSASDDHNITTTSNNNTSTTSNNNSTTTTTTTTTTNTSSSSSLSFRNASGTGEIPSYNGDSQAKATDFANYFCSYAQLYHQKQMLVDHNRMASYHTAILGNKDIFRNKIVMDVGTGSGILAVWAAQAGAKHVYAIEYTDMAKHAEKVMIANDVQHIVTVIQAAVEDVQLPIIEHQLECEEIIIDHDDHDDEEFYVYEKNDHEEEDDDDDNNNTNNDNNNNNNNNNNRKKKKKKKKQQHQQRCVDIIISEWMGYFLLRESMLDSLIRARDTFLKRRSGIMLPSHVTMYIAPIYDEEERKISKSEYSSAMSDWDDFTNTTQQVYGVNMNILGVDYEREQKEYYLLSSKWRELTNDSVLAEPVNIKHFDMITCTLQDARGISSTTISTISTSNDTDHNDDDDDTDDADILHNNNNTTLTTNNTNDGGGSNNHFCFDVDGDVIMGPISGIAGWFTAAFCSRTDPLAKSLWKKKNATTTSSCDDDDSAGGTAGECQQQEQQEQQLAPPRIYHPSYLSTGPEGGYTHWGQQVFYFLNPIPVLQNEITRIDGDIDMTRTQENARLYNCRFQYQTIRIQKQQHKQQHRSSNNNNNNMTDTIIGGDDIGTVVVPYDNNHHHHHGVHNNNNNNNQYPGPVLMKSGNITLVYQIP